MKNCTCYRTDSQKGSALVIVLLIMMTLTVLGIGVIISTSTNVSLSKNYENAIQALNMSEIGVKVAYREFINSGFLKTTHVDGTKSRDFQLFRAGAGVMAGDSLLTTGLANYTVDEYGNFMWEWDSSKGYDPLWDTDTPHGFKFHIYYVTNNAFVIEAEGWYGTIHRRTRAKGEIETMFQFSYFASRDLGEFTRGASQEIKGKVHANGNMYIRPTGSTLNVNTNSFTATGIIIRSRDAWGRPDEGLPGRCFITKDAEGGTFVEMESGSPPGSEGIAYDSNNTLWSDKDLGARKKWGGVVRDKVPYKSPPPIQGLNPGEYYDQLAQNGGLVIDSNSHTAHPAWCTRVTTFYNYNERRIQTLWDINIGNLNSSGNWPSNNLIYCNVPVRLSNAETLNAKLMVASCRNVYTKGDFNTVNKKGASIMTMHRIYHISNNWNDIIYISTTTTGGRTAAETRINAALVDGAPTVDEYNWCDRDGDNHYDINNGVIYSPESPKTAAGWHDAPAPVYGSKTNDRDPWANCDDLLENWSGITLTKFGSVVHLCSTTDLMAANLDNSGIQDDQIAWVRMTGYRPPTRVYMYDPDLATPAGQPPFTPLIGHISSWEPF